MSLVIAIKDKNRFILGADKQVSQWNNKDHSATKVWYSEYEGCCIGSVGYARASQIIQYIKGLLDSAGFGKENLDDAFIHLQLPRTLYETLKAHGIIVDDPTQPFSLPNEFFIAYKDRCWKISQDLTVTEIEDYDAIGSGQDVALGVIETSHMYNEKNPYRIITNAIDVAAEKTLYVDHEIEFVETASDKKDVLNKMTALGYEIPDEVRKSKNPNEALAKWALGINQEPKIENEQKVEEPKSEENQEEKPEKEKTKKKQKLTEDKQ